jgi:Ca2+-binding RTX toxin-like protein
VASRLLTVDTTSPAIGGDDTISSGSGDDIILGGTGSVDDIIHAGDGENIVLGDNGTITFQSGQLTKIEATDPAEGDRDFIWTGNGADIILGGASGDDIYAGGGNDLVFGDYGLIEGVIDASKLPLSSEALGTKSFTFTSIATGPGLGRRSHSLAMRAMTS